MKQLFFKFKNKIKKRLEDISLEDLLDNSKKILKK